MDVGAAALVLAIPGALAGMFTISCLGWLIEQGWKALRRRICSSG